MQHSGPERLQKVLARAGIGSRRRAEVLIAAGRVQVNGRVVTELGARADPTADEVRVNGQLLRPPPSHAYLALHKPPGYVTTVRDPQRRPTVMDLVPVLPGLVPIGRLDVGTEGLLLFSTDGEWAQRVGHPRYGSTKEYIVDVAGVPSATALARLHRPMLLALGESTSGAEVDVVRSTRSGARLRVVLHEGRNRQIRRMFGLVGHPVQHLVRVRVGSIRLGSLKPGQWRRLLPSEVAAV